MSRVLRAVLVAVLALSTTAFGLSVPATELASSGEAAAWPTPGLDQLLDLDVAPGRVDDHRGPR